MRITNLLVITLLISSFLPAAAQQTPSGSQPERALPKIQMIEEFQFAIYFNSPVVVTSIPFLGKSYTYDKNPLHHHKVSYIRKYDILQELLLMSCSEVYASDPSDRTGRY